MVERIAMSEYSEKYSLNFLRTDADGATAVSTSFECEFLPDVLNKVREFLVAAGFTYINTLVAVSDNGEHSSDDL